MPIITAIKPQKNKKRVNIYLDGRFGFGIDLENFVKLGLKVNKELSEDKIAKILKKAEFQKIYDKIVKFATLRPRSEKELKDWLRKKRVHKSLHKSLFNRLKRLDLIDDYQFAKWWVEQRTAFRPRGKMALFSELRQKGIERRIIEKALSEFEVDEEKLAKISLKKKEYRWKKMGKREKTKRMSNYLARKGFSWEAIKEAIKDYL